jgi:hypothetical protein
VDLDILRTAAKAAPYDVGDVGRVMTALPSEAERALEAACLTRFGTLRPNGATLVIRSDNALSCGLPRLPEIVDRFLRSFKDECVWQA